MTLTERQRWALDKLVPPAARTGDEFADWVLAFRELQRRRDEGTELGEIVIQGGHEHAGWDSLAEAYDEPASNLRRWGTPRPRRGDQQ